MVPMLPAELIKHILELLYEDLRSPGRSVPTPFDLWADVRIIHLFHPLLSVSKTFYALALPIAVRHLFLTPDTAVRACDKLDQALEQLSRRGMGWAVRSICLPFDLDAEQAERSLKALPCLRALHSFQLVKNPSALPQSLTTLVLNTTETLDASELGALALATPGLTSLTLSGHDGSGSLLPLHFEESQSVARPDWRLQHLALHYLSGSEEQVLTLITSTATTLETLAFTVPEFGGWETPIFPDSVLDLLDRPLPALRSLNLGELHPLSHASTLLDRSLLPSLEYLTLPIGRNSIHQILTLSLTLIGVSFIAVDHLRLKASSPRAIDTLKTFIKGRPELRLLSVDCSFGAKADSGWYEDLQAECEALDITFASSSMGLAEEEIWTEEEYSGESETEMEIIKRKKREDRAIPFDFDAEDDEIWAPKWSEAKRKEMGFGEDRLASHISGVELIFPVNAQMMELFASLSRWVGFRFRLGRQR